MNIFSIRFADHLLFKNISFINSTEYSMNKILFLLQYNSKQNILNCAIELNNIFADIKPKL